MNPSLKLHFLGTGTIYPHSLRSCSATLLDVCKKKILVDIGPGTFRQMAAAGIDIGSIDYIFITHFHPDHISDLIPLLFSIHNFCPPRKGKTFQIWGPPGLQRFLDGMTRAYGEWVTQIRNDIVFNEFKDEELRCPEFKVSWKKVLHTDESIGYRFEAGKQVLAFSGDSGYCQALVELCRNADVAVLECAHADDRESKGHLTPGSVSRIATEAGIRQIVLNHLYPDAFSANPVEYIQQHFTGLVKIAHDGEIWVIP